MKQAARYPAMRLLCITLAAAAAHKSKKPNWIIATPSMRPEMWDVNDAHKYCAAAAPPANSQTFEIRRLGLDVAGAAAHMVLIELNTIT